MNMDFPSAFKSLLVGEAKAIRRLAWSYGVTVHIEKPEPRMEYVVEPFLGLRDRSDGRSTVRCVPFIPGHDSLFATDWEIVNDTAN